MRFRHSLALSLLTLSLGLLSAFPARSAPVIKKARSLYPELRPALDDRVKGMMQRGNIPGMAIVVIKDGLVLEMKGYGIADRATQNSIGPNTKFGIGSITKPFTAMAIMLLVEEGKVDLDQPIRQYLPDVPTEWAPLTIRQLISHTAGISEDYPSWRVKQSRDLLKLGNPKLDFPPGEAWSYSNTGFRLAGLVIEQVSGQSYTDFMRDRIFTPLNMNQTQAKMAPVPNLATGYRWQRRQYTVVPVKYDRSYASGNIISTAADITKWVQAIDAGKLLKPSSYQQLWTATTLKNGRSTGYGLGWSIGSFKGHPYTEHGGNTAGYSAGLLRYPKDRLNVIVLMNNLNVDGSSIANQIASVYEPTVEIASLSPQPDPQPELTQRFLALLQGNTSSIPLAPEFQLQLKTDRGKAFQRALPSFRTVSNLTFLDTESQSNGDRIYYYKTQWNGGLAYAGIVMTSQDQVASYGVFSPP
jgi:CubicO group peptidase (beta-lactamase class C family)